MTTTCAGMDTHVATIQVAVLTAGADGPRSGS